MVTGNKIQASTDFIDSTQLRNAHPKHRSIRLNADGLSFSLLDKEKNTFLGIREYTFNKIDNPKGLSGKVKELVDTDSILSESFDSSSVSIDIGVNTLIPQAFQSDESDESLLNFIQPTLSTEDLGNDFIRSVEAHNLYPLPSFQLPPSFGDIQVHSSTVFIDAVLRNVPTDDKTRLFIEVGTNHFHLVGLSNRKLVYFNKFSFKTKEDFIYYILFTMEQLQMNPEKTPLVIFGEIDQRSPLFSIAYKYIRFVSFGLRPDGFQFASVLDELPQHYYFSLFHQHLCES